MSSRNIKYNTKLKIIISCISLIICLLLIKDTYAKYVTEASGTADITIAKWKIIVNNQDVITNNEITSIITPVFEGNENIKDGVIAPLAKGYFDLIIDPANTDVTFSYEITTAIDETSAVQDLKVTGYTKNDTDEITFTDESDKAIKDIIYYAEQRSSTKIRMYLTWTDDETSTMDNIADTSATKTTDSQAKLAVKIKFIQMPKASTTQSEEPSQTE